MHIVGTSLQNGAGFIGLLVAAFIFYFYLTVTTALDLCFSSVLILCRLLSVQVV